MSKSYRKRVISLQVIRGSVGHRGGSNPRSWLAGRAVSRVVLVADYLSPEQARGELTQSSVAQGSIVHGHSRRFCVCVLVCFDASNYTGKCS